MSYSNAEIESLKAKANTFNGQNGRIIRHLLENIDECMTRIREKDLALIEGLAGLFMSDELIDEKDYIREIMEDALEHDNMSNFNRAESLSILYKLIEGLERNPNDKKALATFLKRANDLRKEDDPLAELREEWKHSIGAMMFHDGFLVGVKMEKDRIHDAVVSFKEQSGIGFIPGCESAGTQVVDHLLEKLK